MVRIHDAGRGLLSTSTNFTCPGGQFIAGNNQLKTLPSSLTSPGSFLCRTSDIADCADGVPCNATCTDPAATSLTPSRTSTGTDIVKKGDEEVDVDNGIYKGCDAYCVYSATATPGVPRRPTGTPCGLSHADFCYKN